MMTDEGEAADAPEETDKKKQADAEGRPRAKKRSLKAARGPRRRKPEEESEGMDC